MKHIYRIQLKNLNNGEIATEEYYNGQRKALKEFNSYLAIHGAKIDLNFDWMKLAYTDDATLQIKFEQIDCK